MEISQTQHNSHISLELVGKIDTTASEHFEQELNALLAAGNKNLVFDFAKVDFISSTALNVLLDIAKKVQPEAGKLILCGMSNEIMQVFDVSGFSDIFTIMPDLASANSAMLLQ